MEKIFKAKRIDNGEWIYSDSLDFLDSDDYVLMGKKDAIYGVVWHKCDKNTICQYTGINDSEGNRIFEGDEAKNCIGNKCVIYFNERIQQTCIKHYEGSEFTAKAYVLEGLTLTGQNIHERCE